MKFDDSVKLGHKLLKRAGEEVNLDIDTVPEAVWKAVLRDSGVDSKESFFADLGLGKYLAGAIVNRFTALTAPITGLAGRTESPMMKAVKVTGNEGVAVSLATCCHPIPGDDIWGFMRPGKGLSIHCTSCEHTVKGRSADPGPLDGGRVAPAAALCPVPCAG